MTASEGPDSQRQSWLRAIILWRASKPFPRDFGGNAAAFGTALRRARVASEQAGRISVGGFFAKKFFTLEYSPDYRRVWVLGQEFAIPLRDSAIVVMVDRVDELEGPPVVVGHEYISGRLPDLYWATGRTSRDSFSVVLANSYRLLESAMSVNPKLRAFLAGQNVSPAVPNRQFPMMVIQNQCIDFQDVKRGSESWQMRDCKVSHFGALGNVGGKSFYYATYCIIPNYPEKGMCGDTSFIARMDEARGLAIFERGAGRNDAQLLFERVNGDIGLYRYTDKPEIIRNRFGTILYLPIAVDGTGNYNESEYYIREAGKWERIDSDAWLVDLSTRIPRGFEVWKGIWPDLHTMQAKAMLYRSGDANCCPTGGVASIRLSIRSKKLVIESMAIDTTTSPVSKA